MLSEGRAFGPMGTVGSGQFFVFFIKKGLIGSFFYKCFFGTVLLFEKNCSFVPKRIVIFL